MRLMVRTIRSARPLRQGAALSQNICVIPEAIHKFLVSPRNSDPWSVRIYFGGPYSWRILIFIHSAMSVLLLEMTASLQKPAKSSTATRIEALPS